MYPFMNPLEHLHLQLRLEGKEVLAGTLLRQVEVVPGEDMPLMLIAHLADQRLVAYFDETLRPDLRIRLQERIPNIAFPNIEPLLTLLQQENIPVEIGHYRTSVIPESYVSFEDETVRRYLRSDPKDQATGFDGPAKEMFGIEKDGQIISSCLSTRENAHCGEAWVYTDENHRHQGLAQKVVSAWAASLLNVGKVPFYSHKIQNSASAKLAKRLLLQPAFEEIVISYAHV
jgi:RimJ/RimL family protein N-acetyltransferase